MNGAEVVFSPNTPFALALRGHHATAKSLESHVLQVQSLVELRRIVSLLRTSEILLREKLVTGSSAERGRSLDTRSTKSGVSCLVSFLTGSCEKMRFISFTPSSKGPNQDGSVETELIDWPDGLHHISEELVSVL